MIGNERNFSLSLWDHKDNFIGSLKSSNSYIEGQTYNENFIENINGEKTLSFSIPMYIFNPDAEEGHQFEKNNILWDYIKNEQKIRYIEYDDILNTPIKIQEFVLKDFSEERSGEEKIANCTCEFLAVYELGKVGWGISFDTDYITDYELGYNENKESNCPDLLTIDYWLKKIFYKETNLGRVSNTTECTYLLQGLQLRNDEGYPISNDYIEKEDGSRDYEIIEEPICISVTSEEFIKYYNPIGWEWEVQGTFENDPDKISISTLYENPTINKYIEKIPNYYEAQSYQKRIGESDDTKELRPHPIPDNELEEWTYVTDVKKRLIVEERSNVFSIIQDLCESFSVWAYFIYEYSQDGKIIHRKIVFKTESIDEDIKFDFAYGKNLQSCSRIINSNDLVTKLMVPPVESTLVDGSLLSIQQATANPTGENYIYNFDYFYDLGTFTKESSLSTNSDEYKIKLHCGKLRDINNKILNLQKFLAPIYDKQGQLQSELVVLEGAKTGYMDNIQSIQNKIDAIPTEDQIIKSWTVDNTQYSHLGQVKTYSTTTKDGEEYQYLNFGREDITISSSTISITNYELIDNEVISNSTKNFNVSGFTPRSFNYQTWSTGDNVIEENETSPYFTEFIQDGSDVKYDYSELGENIFIKGIFFRNQDRGVYGRIRYKYAPLAYYYLLIQDYWEKLKEVQNKINKLNGELKDVNNKILIYELDLKKLLNNKRELILQFEKDYKPFIREGYWEPTDYQSQVNNKIFDTNDTSNFDGLFIKTYELKDLKLNDSLHNYTYYIELDNLSEIDIDSIEMTTETIMDNVPIRIPRYKGHDFEFYRKNNEDSLIIGINPDLVDKVNADLISKYTKKSYLKYIRNGEQISEEYNWTEINENNNPSVSEYYIYISNDNILIDSLIVYGNSASEENKLVVYEDYNYSFESTAYNENTGERIDTDEWDGISENVYYDYSLKIELKLTNNVIRFLNSPRFIIVYTEDSTLQYLFNDSIETSKKYAYPQVEYSISVVDLSSLNGYKLYKPKIGQKVPIWDIEMGFMGYEGFITSISYNLEQKENTEITIATYNTKFEDIFQKLTATMSDVSYNENKIYNAANSFESNGEIKTEVFQKSLEDNFNRISLGTNNDITIDKETGITLKDNNSSNAVKLIGNGIFLTENYNDNQTQWKTGITGKGINADALTVGNIDTKQINIWNSSEGQIRFRWNEQGLFAYGDGTDLNPEGGVSTSTATTSDLDKIIDYNKYVKFNQDGLNFSDGGKSALTLNWTGLNINTQDNSLILDANNGLILTEWENGSGTNRLQLGKLDNGNIYGLKLKDTSGSTTFQSDSDGNLWLSKFINIGGNFDDSTTSSTFKPINPTAGIVGITTNEPQYQMGVMRDTTTGNIIFKTSQLRFWAGPQTKTEYLTNLSMSTTDLPEAVRISFEGLSNYDPALSKFKVDSEGNIIASGIDVGGWIGAGKILRSKNFEAILRSDGYTDENPNFPVFAIGKSDNDTSGKSHNFRVYQDGSINIGNGNFTATSTGIVNASNLTINGGSISLGNGTFVVNSVGELTASSVQISGGGISGTGININNRFIVNGATGSVTASDIVITGANNTSNWIIDADEFQVSKIGQIGAGIIPLSNPSIFSYDNYDFSVSDGNVRFRGSIYAYYGSSWYQGVDSTTISIQGASGYTNVRVVKGLIVGTRT